MNSSVLNGILSILKLLIKKIPTKCKCNCCKSECDNVESIEPVELEEIKEE